MAYGVYSYEWVETSIEKFVVLHIAGVDISMFVVGKLVGVSFDNSGNKCAIVKENERIYRVPLTPINVDAPVIPMRGPYDTREEAMEAAEKLARNPR